MDGSVDSVSLTRVLLIRTITRSVVANPQALTDVYVDDMAQQVTGSKEQVISQLLKAASDLHGQIIHEGGIFSPKSIVVASKRSIAKQVDKALKVRSGVVVGVTTVARDSGIDHSGGSKRRVMTVAKRQGKGFGRLPRVSIMTNARNSGYKLTLAGCCPRIMWGTQVLGVAPSTMRKVRCGFVTAAGISIRGRCAIIALAPAAA